MFKKDEACKGKKWSRASVGECVRKLQISINIWRAWGGSPCGHEESAFSNERMSLSLCFPFLFKMGHELYEKLGQILE